MSVWWIIAFQPGPLAIIWLLVAHGGYPSMKQPMGNQTSRPPQNNCFFCIFDSNSYWNSSSVLPVNSKQLLKWLHIDWKYTYTIIYIYIYIHIGSLEWSILTHVFPSEPWDCEVWSIEPRFSFQPDIPVMQNPILPGCFLHSTYDAHLVFVRAYHSAKEVHIYIVMF